MQKPNLNPPIRSVCTTSDGAASYSPVFITGTYYDAAYDSNSNDYKRWYRKYSDGTIVQGAYREDADKDAVWTVPFVTPFTTTDIDIQITPVFNDKPTQINGGMAVECWSRVTGYFRPVSAWNKGKKEEFHDRVMFNVPPANCCERKKNG